MIYVALLRGINVGGKQKIAMVELKVMFEQLGYTNVRTYINSGNVVFATDASPEVQLAKKVERGILKHFSLTVPVVVRNISHIQSLVEKIPDDWANDSLQRTDVMFLWEDIDSPDVLEHIATKPDIETVLYLPGALVWNIGRQNVARGGGIKLIGTDIYKFMTARNINTVRKLLDLMHAAGS